MATILVIEDETGIREDIAEALRQVGYDVREAGNGEDGLTEILAAPRPDLVICDRQMPHMSGDTLLANLRTQHPALLTLPFIFLTAFADLRDRHAVSDLAPTLYLGKPIDHRDLVRLVRDILEGRSRSA